MSGAIYGLRGTVPAGVTLTASGLVIAGVAGKRIRLYAAFVSALVATNVKFQSNAVDISGTFAIDAKSGFILPAVQLSWMITGVGESLNLNMSVATTVGLQVIYDLD